MVCINTMRVTFLQPICLHTHRGIGCHAEYSKAASRRVCEINVWYVVDFEGILHYVQNDNAKYQCLHPIADGKPMVCNKPLSEVSTKKENPKVLFFLCAF